ncbi:MAG TPA: glycosyltransferase [Pyrinomonadaceae bacterium]|nr:glycosyltransferase [Pyrinomonadaceae bacterium]
MSSLVSIIMPAYNAEKYIAASIQSVLNQTYENWELVVVDDGSTDRTAEVVRPFLSADGRIKYFFQQNGGQGQARNAGLAGADGELIAFLDSDDLWSSEKLALQVERIQEARADLVYSDAFIFSDGEKSPEVTTFSAITPQFIYGRYVGDDAFKLLFAYNRIPTLTVLARRDVLNQVGLFDGDRKYQNCEDYDLWLKLAKAGAVFWGMKEKLAYYRHHASSMMNNDSRLLKPMLAVLKKHSHGSVIDDGDVRLTVRNVYRQLISALVEENKIGEAKDYIKEFSAWDKRGLTTWLQKGLITVAPNKFNLISKEILYRAEWHVTKMLKGGRLLNS